MTNNNDRLDRIEAILERIASREEEFNNRIDSNARTIQAMLEEQATERLRHEERMRSHEEQIAELRRVSIQLANTTNGIANLLASLDDDRPTILRLLNSIDSKVDRLLGNS
jgi:chromosome segregation ATPase